MQVRRCAWCGRFLTGRFKAVTEEAGKPPLLLCDGRWDVRPKNRTCGVLHGLIHCSTPEKQWTNARNAAMRRRPRG